jgi:site-specific recombinase XerD
MACEPHGGPGWTNRVDQFCAHLETEEERSSHTRRSYRDTLLAFASWYRQQHGEDPELARIDKRDALDWKDHIERNGRADRQGNVKPAALATVNRKLSALRMFVRWAKDQGLADPRLDAPRPRKRHGRPKPKSLEPDERKALLKKVEGQGDTRDILLIRTGLEAGLRVAELAALHWSDVKITERKGSLTVRHGKGNKQRAIDLTKSLRHDFLEHGYERNRGKDKPVFTNSHGKGLSVRGIQDIVERLAATTRVGKRIGLDGCTAHTLRHTCADFLLNEVGLSVPEVAEILGHSDLKTTMVYLAPHTGRLADRMAAIEG